MISLCPAGLDMPTLSFSLVLVYYTKYLSLFCEINLESLTMLALDDMGNRIDELEQSINDLRIEMGQEGSSSPSAAVKSKDDTKSADDSA
uniref:Putative heat shock factor-binding protein 1-like n=1 Tax=Solanum chacoense TaxID=4108 RepID=A0A0V0GQT8_SOLCH